MAQTQLGRTYVQALDAAGGASTNSLSLGTKSLTTSVIIGGLGTENKSITVNALGTSIAGPAFLTTLTTTGNSILANVSVASLGVTGNVSMANVSINTLNVVGPTGLNTLEVSALSKLQNVSVLGVLDVVGQIKMGNVSTTSLTATSLTSTSLFATNLSVSGLTTLNNASVKGLLYANEMETPFMNVSTTATIKDATITGTLGVTGKTTLQALDVNGVTTFNNTVTVYGTDNSLTVNGITTLNNASVNGTLAVVGNCDLSDVQTKALTATGNSKIGDWFMYGGTDTKALGTVNHSAKYALLQDATGVTALNADNTAGGGKILFKVANDTKMTLLNDGSFGIGVLAPTTKLDVGGTVKVEGETKINAVGTADTTIGQSTGGTTYLKNATTTVGGTLGVTGKTTLANASMTGAVDINVTGTLNTTIGNSTAGLTVNGSLKTNTITSTTSTGALTIGTDLTGAGTVAVGATDATSTTINGKVIKQVVPLLGGGAVKNIEIVNGGDVGNSPCLCNVFNRKNTTTLTAIRSYSLGAPLIGTAGYFEIVINGTNNVYGPYIYKGCFCLTKPGATIQNSSVNTLFSFGGIPTITFTYVNDFSIDMYISTAFSGSTNQNFVSTLTSYPTTSIVFNEGLYYGYIISAV